MCVDLYAIIGHYPSRREELIPGSVGHGHSGWYLLYPMGENRVNYGVDVNLN